jgi:hypothetical protein
MENKYLYMTLLGCTPKGRLTEQHDIFFGIAGSLRELVPAIKASWPEAEGVLHVDAWRKVTQVGGFEIRVMAHAQEPKTSSYNLFFINLGGYKPNEFDEFHYKTLVVAKDKAEAIKLAKQTVFYKHVGFKTAPSHIDDQYGVDVDEIHDIQEILSKEFTDKYYLSITEKNGLEDEMHLGYFILQKL